MAESSDRLRPFDDHRDPEARGPRPEDYGDLVIMPGVVDSHVHVNEPGRTEWEGFETATRAAAAGGITTIVDMPLNSIPATTTVDALRVKSREMSGKIRVDVGLWGGVIPGNLPELRPMLDAGALGFKCFLVHSGVDEFPNVDEQELRAAARELATDRCAAARSRGASRADRVRARERRSIVVSHLPRFAAGSRGWMIGDRAAAARLRGNRRAHSRRASLFGERAGHCVARASATCRSPRRRRRTICISKPSRFRTAALSSNARRRFANTRTANGSGEDSKRD